MLATHLEVRNIRILTIDLGRRTPPTLHSTLSKVATSYVVERDATEGLLRCREDGYSVAVLCIDRAGTAETGFAADLRRDGTQIPLLVIAGRTNSDNIVGALDSGADDYLPGDRTAAELAARVRALARREPQLTSTLTTYGDITLDQTAHRAWRADRELELTSLQFTLLETLFRHHGRALTRTQLLEQVWDPASDTSSNVVDQAIAALRRAIGKDRIRTVHGVGYRAETT